MKKGCRKYFAATIGMPLEEALGSPFMVIGDLSMIRDHLLEVTARYGTPYITLSEDQAWDLAPLVEELS